MLLTCLLKSVKMPWGSLCLSRRKAKLVKGWEYVQTALDKDEVIEGFVKRRTKGGLIVDVFGIEAFLPVHKLM